MTVRTFATPGYTKWPLPSNIDKVTPVTVDLRGAGGGSGVGGSGGRIPGGTGGRVIGLLDISAMNPGDPIHVWVGGAGGNGNANGTGGAGGTNYGGTGGSSTNGRPGGGGGGETDIRIGASGIFDSGFSPTRKAVAAGGGGGGGGFNTDLTHGGGGDGGSTTGAVGVTGAGDAPAPTGGGGGTPSAGGSGGTAGAGTATNGGDGIQPTGGSAPNVTAANYLAGGGGGAGYWGGGSGANCRGSSPLAGIASGGGGGSNYVGGLASFTTNARGAGAASETDGWATLTYNLIPNQPALQSPTTDADTTKTISFVWVFSDPDPTDTQSKADWRWRVGSGAWTTVSAVATTDQFYSVAPHVFDAYLGQTIEWQVRTYDSFNAVSVWSASAYFIPRNAPTAATFDVTPIITSHTPVVQLNMPDTAARWEVKITDNSGVDLPRAFVGVWSVENRQTHVTVVLDDNIPGSPNPTPMVNGSTYHILARYERYLNVWSDWLDSGPLVANINAPLQPVVQVSQQEDTGSVTLLITNPTPDPYGPAYNDIYRQNLTTGEAEVRVATHLVPGADYTDWTVGFHHTYLYRVVAVADSGSYTST